MCRMTLSGTDWPFTSWIIDLDFTVDKYRLWCHLQLYFVKQLLWGTKSCLSMPRPGFPGLKLTSCDRPCFKRGPQPLKQLKSVYLHPILVISHPIPSYPVLSLPTDSRTARERSLPIIWIKIAESENLTSKSLNLKYPSSELANTLEQAKSWKVF